MAIKFLNTVAVDTDVLYVDASSNKVGIGTTSPSQALEVNGNIQATGTRSISSLFDANHYMRLESNSSGGILKGADGGVTTTLVRTYGDSYFNGGNVGIGTTSPQQKLHVAGNGRFESGATGLGGYVTVGNPQETAGNYSAYFFGNTIHDNIYMKGAIAYETLSTTNGRGDMHFLQNSAANGTNASISDSVMTILNDGNVGIGTTSPSQRTVISGPSTNPLLNTTVPSSATLLLSNSDTAYGTYFCSLGTGTGLIQQRRQTSAVYYDLAINPYGGNVGIGTTSPNSKLQVNVGTDQNIGFNSDSSVARISSYNDAFSASSPLKINGSDLRFDISTVEKMRITSDGNVGIGTTSPNNFGFLEKVLNISAGSSSSTTLQQAGIVVSSSSDADDADDFGYLSFTNYQSSTSNGRVAEIRALKNGTNVDTGEFAFYTSSGSGPAERMRIASTGNVGIGTTSPAHKLTINASNNTTALGIDFPSAHFDFSANSTSGYTSNFRINDVGMDIGHDSTARSLNLQTGDQDRLTILGTGNVGIGTTSPVAKLHVFNSGYPQLNLESNAGSWQVGVSTGNDFAIRKGSSGSVYPLWIDNNENVGIGTTSPSYKLSVNGDIQSDVIRGYQYPTNSIIDFDDDTLPGSLINSVSIKSVGSMGFMLDSNNNGTADAFIWSKDSLDFSTGTELMRLTNSGNVGIGTTSPQDLLHLSADSPVLRLTNTVDTGKSSIEFWDNQSGTSQAGEVFYDDNSNLFGLQGNGNGIVFRANNTFPGSELMRLNGSGNLGIGTTSPNAKLEVVGTGQFLSGSSGVQLYGTGGSGNINSLGTNDLIMMVNGNEKMRIRNSGNVGIGTTSPDSILHVKNGDAGVTPYSLGTGLNIEGTTSTVGINIISSDTAQGRIYFASPSSNTAGAIEYNHNASLSSGFMKFRTGNSERMRITGDGNVGIGTTSPNYKLAVYGSSTDSEIVASFGSANDVYEYTAIGLSGFIASNGATKAGLALKRTSTYGTGELHFLNNNTLDNSDMNLSDSKMMINSSGNVGIGTTSPQSKLQVAGGVQMADDTDAASADKVGTLRYRTSGNNSYVDMCMQTGATTYEWVNIVQNNW